MTATTITAPRTYQVRTFGCQMNVHDSERLAGMLEEAGYVRAEESAIAQGEVDIVVLNTCAVRENADNKLYGNLGQLAAIKRERPGMQIAVGGCLAQKIAPPSWTARPGSMWCSVPTTSVRFPFSWSEPGTMPRPRSRSWKRWKPSHRPCPPSVMLPIPGGYPFRWAVTTPAPFASCRTCAAKNVIAARGTSWPR